MLLALWATAAMAAMGITQATQLSQGLKWMGRLQEQDQALFLCWTGLELSARILADDADDLGRPWDAPRELWGQVPEEAVLLEGGTVGYRIADEQGRVPLNSAPPEVLGRLPGFTQEAVAQILALRAEGKGIAHLGQLAAVPGFQAASLAELEPLVSVHSAGAVNLNTASESVLAALDVSANLMQAILIYRKGGDGVEGTPDDAVFTDVDTIFGNLEALLPMLDDRVELGNLISSQQIGVRSSLFRVALEGKSARHEVARRAVAVLDRGAPGDAPQLRGWHEAD